MWASRAIYFAWMYTNAKGKKHDAFPVSSPQYQLHSASKIQICHPTIEASLPCVQREQLTEVILRLLGAWGDPLSQLHQSMRQDQNRNKNRARDFSHLSSNKALEMSDVMQELRDGVLKMAEKMKLQGVLGNAVAFVQPERELHSSAFSFYKRGGLSSLDRNDLLYCLRRDSDKVKNYLRILQCSTLPGLDC
uniref:Prolactin 2 n=1 Tax=Hippocampus comes TaxID=109280 RepID=A0A3Q2XXV1_HIPCM